MMDGKLKVVRVPVIAPLKQATLDRAAAQRAEVKALLTPEAYERLEAAEREQERQILGVTDE